MDQVDAVALVTVRSDDEAELHELGNYLATINCSIGPTTREASPADLNYDPGLAQEIAFKALVPIATSLLPKLVEWALARKKTATAAPIIVQIKGKRISISASSDPAAIQATIDEILNG